MIALARNDGHNCNWADQRSNIEVSYQIAFITLLRISFKTNLEAVDFAMGLSKQPATDSDHKKTRVMRHFLNWPEKFPRMQKDMAACLYNVDTCRGER